METIISSQWWRSYQFLACKGLCIFKFCVMSRKVESEPNIQYCLRTAVGSVQRFITIQNFGHSWRSGIFSRESPLCIFFSMFNDITWRNKDNKKECIANSTPVFICKKKIQQHVGHSSDLVFYLQRKTTRRMGQSRWIDVDEIQRKGTPSFPSHESIVSRNAQTQKRWKIIDTFLCRWRYE